VIRRTSLLALEVALGLAATCALGVGLLWWRLSSGPIELVSVKQHIEQQLSQARGGRPVKIDRIQLGWGDGRSALQIRALGVHALDSKRHEVTTSREVTIGLGLDRLLVGRVAVTEAHFHGGDLTITSARDGSTRIAFGPPGAPADIVLAPAPADETMRQRVTRLLNDMAAAFRPVGPGAELQAISVENARLTLVDEKTGGRWVGADAAFDLRRWNTSLRLHASASLNGPKGPAPFSATIATDTGFQAASIEVKVKGAKPQALAPAPNLGPLAALTTPVTLKINAALDRAAGVTRLDGEARLGPGSLDLGGGRLDISGGRLRGRYDLGGDTLYVDEAMLGGARTKVRGQAKLAHASSLFSGASAEPARFEIASPRIDFEMPGAFEGPLAIEQVAATGLLRLDQSAVEIENFQADVEKARLHVVGRVFWGDDGKGVTRLGLKLDGRVDGDLAPQTVVRYWPVHLVGPARNWCRGAIIGGRLFNTTVRVDFKPADLAGGVMPDDKVSVKFDFDNAAVRYVEEMTPLSAAEGRAELRGNSFQAVVKKGAIADIAIANGNVSIPRLFPDGALGVYSGRANGDMRSIVKLLLQAPIGLDERLPFDPATIVGKGAADFAIRRPVAAGVPGDATQFSVDGRFDNVGATAKSGDYTLSQWKLRVRGDDKALTLAGPLAVGRSTAELTWVEHVRAKASPSSITLRGFPILKYAAGPVSVEARSTGRGLDVAKADVKLDFTGASVTLPKGFWKKQPGAPATLKFAVARAADKTLLLSGLEARGAGVNVSGQARVNDSGDLIEAALPRAVLQGAADGELNARRDSAGVLQVAVKGPYLNVGPFFEPDAPRAPSADQMLATTHTYDAKMGALSREYAISADVGRLRLRGEADLTNARLVYTAMGDALERLYVSGVDPQAKPLELSITPAPGRPTGALAFRAGDAGFAVRAITGVDNVKGGTVEADGAWVFGENPSAQINLRMRGFQLVKAPAMAHLLSSVASLRGMVETLNGQGIAFNDLDAPMTMADGRLILADCRAAGPSLGITAKGVVNLYSGALDIDGVLVPSYGLNSMLGVVPILGDLLVSRKGEGVVGLTYSIHGPADDPRVGMNPLSALTPGILRRIFEPALRRAPRNALTEKAG
jgi:hypothetical protein